MNTPNPAPTTASPTPSASVVLVLTELAAAHDLTGPLRALVDTRQSGVGFLTVEAAKAMDDLIRQEKRDRYLHAVQGIKVSGAAPAPGWITAFSLLAEWHALLVDTENDAVKTLGYTGTSEAPDRDGDEARFVRVADLIGSLDLTDGRLLDRVHRATVDLTTRMRRAIDGDQRIAAPVNCPWCGNDTLVIDLEAGTATCGRDRANGRLEPCLCTHSWCTCTTAGTRHVWHRSKGHQADGWQTLASLTRDQREDQR